LARFSGLARRRATTSLDETIERLRPAGYSQVYRPGPFEARLRSPTGGTALRLRMTQEGRIFGGNYGLEIATENPVLPPTRGLSARGRGVVRLRGVTFRARRGDEQGRRLAERLQSDEGLGERLGRVHFELIRVEPSGRPAIRHLGGSVVWILFPPIVKTIPLVPEQVQATLAALDAFAAVGRDADSFL
jgi:Protein of unknown function (DUF3156)